MAAANEDGISVLGEAGLPQRVRLHELDAAGRWISPAAADEIMRATAPTATDVANGSIQVLVLLRAMYRAVELEVCLLPV